MHLYRPLGSPFTLHSATSDVPELTDFYGLSHSDQLDLVIFTGNNTKGNNCGKKALFLKGHHILLLIRTTEYNTPTCIIKVIRIFIEFENKKVHGKSNITVMSANKFKALLDYNTIAYNTIELFLIIKKPINLELPLNQIVPYGYEVVLFKNIYW